MATSESNPDSEEELTDPTMEVSGGDRSEDRGGLILQFRDQLAAGRSALESKRGSSRVIDIVFHATERQKRVPATLLAGALASRLVLYAIPFLVLIVVTTGAYSQVTDANPTEIARSAGMAGLLAEAVEDSTRAADGVRIAAVIGMAFATMWAADSLGNLVRRTHALVWAVPIAKIHRRWALPFVVIGVSIGMLATASLGIQAGG